MTDLDALEARHRPATRYRRQRYTDETGLSRTDYTAPPVAMPESCADDRQRWPCDTARLLPVVRAALALDELEWSHLPGDYWTPSMAALRDALREAGLL